MLNEQKPDGVIICIGPHAHAELASKILRMGYPVYTEKPPAPNSKTALEVARAAKGTGKLCMTAFKKRYTEAAGRAKEFIESFCPDKLYSISIDYCSAKYSNLDERNSFLLDFGIHLIDLTGYLFGDVIEVFAYSKDMDAYAVSLRFKNGAVGTMNLNDERSFVVPTEEIEITAEGGNFMTIHNSSVWRITKEGKCCEWREPPTFVSGGDSGNDTGHFAEIRYFVNALKEKITSAPSQIYESYKSMILYEAIAESAKTGKPVAIKYETL